MISSWFQKRKILSVLFLEVFDRDLKTNWLLPQLHAHQPRAEEVVHGGKCYIITNSRVICVRLLALTHSHNGRKYCNVSLSVQGMVYCLILICPQDLDILRMNLKVELMTSKAAVLVCLTHILFNLRCMRALRMHVIKRLMHNVFIHFCLSFGRIKRNEKEIQSKMKMCTGANVSLAHYFNGKLNTDKRCHWG